MKTRYLCKRSINTKEYTEAEKNGYFYNYFKYKETNIETLVCNECHNTWYYFNKPISE